MAICFVLLFFWLKSDEEKRRYRCVRQGVANCIFNETELQITRTQSYKICCAVRDFLWNETEDLRRTMNDFVNVGFSDELMIVFQVQFLLFFFLTFAFCVFFGCLFGL